MKSQITYALRPKITYAGKAVKLHKQILNETITAVRSVNYVPDKYIDNNLVWNKDNEVFAYYELIPYNYSFLSPEQKYLVHDSFRQLIAQSREGKIHALQIATESSIRSIQEQSKKLVTGKLREVAIQKIDDQTEALVSMIGDNQVDYRFFLGFKLMVTEDEVNLKNIKNRYF